MSKTALELKREGWLSYRRGPDLRSTPQRLTPEEQRERDRLLARVQASAKMLKKQYGVRRVVLFGSLARTAWFSSDSDVDLAVEGLETKSYWRAWKLTEDIIEDRPVDFVEIESVSESLKKAIDRYGVEL
jgi:predicted nucleotidyltransferase